MTEESVISHGGLEHVRGKASAASNNDAAFNECRQGQLQHYGGKTERTGAGQGLSSHEQMMAAFAQNGGLGDVVTLVCILLLNVSMMNS